MTTIKVKQAVKIHDVRVIATIDQGSPVCATFSSKDIEALQPFDLTRVSSNSTITISAASYLRDPLLQNFIAHTQRWIDQFGDETTKQELIDRTAELENLKVVLDTRESELTALYNLISRLKDILNQGGDKSEIISKCFHLVAGISRSPTKQSEESK